MPVVYKYKLDLDTIIEMPVASQILTVQMQGDDLCMWALVNPALQSVRRSFRVYGTGHIMYGEPIGYVGTFQMNGGLLVFHVFEYPPNL